MVTGNRFLAVNEYKILLLGPPQILHLDEPLSVRRRQVRALLYYLANELAPVSREQLAFLFWPDRSDATARRNLTRLLSATRAELGDDVLLSIGRGQVALNEERVWSDCTAFEQICASDRRERLEEALSLYRGPFLDGFFLSGSPVFSRWQDEQQRERQRRYLDLLQRLGDLCRTAGDLAAAVDHLRRSLVVDDLAEGIHRRLITLYAEGGDRAAAAAQFERCALILERELGVSPLPETRAAYEASRSARAPAPQIPPAWSVLPSLDLPLTGREAAWQALADAHGRLRSGGLILISGEPGVGKSRLMQTFATGRQALVLAANNPPGAQTSAYTAIAAVLRQALPHQTRWQGIRPVWLAEVGRLLPEISHHFPDLPPPVEVEPAQAQARLFEALSRCLLGLARTGPILLCLDDLHWADRATLSWLATLPGRLAGSGVIILGTYRTAHAGTLADLRQAFTRPDLLAELPLSRLSAEAVAEILSHLPQRPPDLTALAGHIHHATGGNSFFVLETMRVLLEAGQLTDPPADLPLAPTVQAAIRRRLQRLSPLARQVVETAAVLAGDLRLGLLEATAGRSALEVAEGLDELTGRQLLVNGDGRRFGHELLRQVAYEGISPWRRRILHRRAAVALESTGDRQNGAAWATIAGHYDRADETAYALRCYEQAARAAQALYAHREAIQHLRRALDLVPPQAAATTLHRRLLEALGDSLAVAGEFTAAEKAFRAALASVPDDNPLQKAGLELKLAETFIPQQRPGAAETTYRAALARLDGRPPQNLARSWRTRRLEILLGLHDAFYFQDQPEAMAARQGQTEILLQQVGTPELEVRFLTRSTQLGFLRNRFQVTAQNLARARKALALAQAAGSLAQTARQLFHLGFHLLWHHDFDESERFLQRALASAEEVGISWLQNQCLAYLTVVYRFLGDAERLGVILPQFARLSERIGYANYIGVCAANSAWLAYRSGTWQGMQRQAEGALDSWVETFYPFHWLAHWVLLALSIQEDRLEDAVAAARAMLDPDQQQLRGELPSVLEEAVSAWDRGQPEVTRQALQRAVSLAEDAGYL